MLSPASEYSRFVLIRGDALTGTSRTVYEAVTDVLPGWALEHPPTVAALADLLRARIAPQTVLWLGELRHHADADGGAAVLQRLDDVLEADGQVIAIATIWPGYWDSYAAAAAAGRGATDPAAVVGRLLAPLDVLAEYDPDSLDPAYGGIVDVPARFTGEEMAAAAQAGDPVLAAAVAAAGPGGQVVKHLAGAADLIARYAGPGADPYGRAIITAAMDAARLGHAGPLSVALLRDAAPGYLAGPPAAAGAWDTALAWAADSAWALQPVPPTPGNGTPGYRVAGYLDQHGRRTRADQPAPATLWEALVTHVKTAGDQDRLAQAAADRGLYRHAATLWTAAAAAGRTDAAARLITQLGALADPAQTTRAARWAARQARLDDPWPVARLLAVLQAAGAADAVQILLARDPAAQVDLRHRWDVADLLRTLRAADAAGAARALVVRAAEHAGLADKRYLPWLLRALREAGATGALDALAARIASQADVEGVSYVTQLLIGLHAVGAAGAIRALAARAVDAVEVEDPGEVAELLTGLLAAGAADQVQALLARDPVRHARFDNPWSAADLLEKLHAAGAADAVRALALRAADQVSLEDGEYVARLLGALDAVGAGDAIPVLLARDPAGQVRLMFGEDVAQLIEALHAAGAGEAVQALAARVVAEADPYYLWAIPVLSALGAAQAWDAVRAISARMVQDMNLDDPEAVAELLQDLRGVGSTAPSQASQAVQALLARDPADRASLADPWGVTSLLVALTAAGAQPAVRTIAARAAEQIGLDDPLAVARLLAAMRAARADDAVRILCSRAAHGARLHDAQGVAQLLGELRAAGATEATRTLLARDPGHQVAIDASQPFRPGQTWAFGQLLTALRAAGAAEAVQILAGRAADAGMFGLYLEVNPDQAVTYRFGREPDRTPAPPWSWSEPGDVSGMPH